MTVIRIVRMGMSHSSAFLFVSSQGVKDSMVLNITLYYLLLTNKPELAIAKPALSDETEAISSIKLMVDANSSI